MTFDAGRYDVRQGERIDGGVLELDGQWFTGCEISNAILLFKGRKPFGYAETTFENCRLVSADAAEMILAQVVGMMPALIDADDLRGALLSVAAGKVTLN